MSVKQVRQYLRQHEDGATEAQIAQATNLRRDYVRYAIKNMPEAEVDRWSPGKTPGSWVEVWRVLVPKHCPRPE